MKASELTNEELATDLDGYARETDMKGWPTYSATLREAAARLRRKGRTMASNNETVADIVKRVRRDCNSYPLPTAAAEMLKLVREIKAANKREVAELRGERNGVLKANASLAADNDRLRREVAELRECLEQAYGDKIGTYTMKGNEVERWRKALEGAEDAGK